MLDMVEAFAYCGLPQGGGLGIITQSGGAGVLMADHAEALGLTVPVLGVQTQQALQKTIPGFGASANPVDITGQFVADPALLRDSVRIVMDDPQVYIGIIWLQLMDAYVDTLLDIFAEIKAQVSKPFVVCWVAASISPCAVCVSAALPSCVVPSRQSTLSRRSFDMRKCDVIGRSIESIGGMRRGAYRALVRLPVSSVDRGGAGA